MLGDLAASGLYLHLGTISQLELILAAPSSFSSPRSSQTCCLAEPVLHSEGGQDWLWVLVGMVEKY